ncbi:uncharacterized protein LOC123305586 [Chrysoperla carnea]|uniref:uncharacterized protein LOC123305586 n=1 Tax=Chrysoperla carnea TaxID=189513 RepID=UPI001D0869DB|nr:uncharacterized protein LOC123305586 [Chrysoperla carnea]
MLWSRIECDRKQLPVTPENQRCVLGRALTLIDFSMMTLNEFEKEPVQSRLLGDNEIQHFRKILSSNANFTERPRCSISPIEKRLKFNREMEKFSRNFLRGCYFIIKKTIFVTGFILLNFSKSNVVELELWSLTSNKKNGELYITAKPTNNDTSSTDTLLTFMFDKPCKLTKRNYGMSMKYDVFADDNQMPNWRLLPKGVIEHCGHGTTMMKDYFHWSIDNDFVSEIIFYE